MLGLTRVPQSASVMSSTRRTEIPARYISINASSTEPLPPPVAFDDRSLKGLAPQLRNLEINLAGAGLQRPFIAASAGILPSFATFVTCCPAKLVRLSIQHGIQRLLDRPTNHLAKMVSNPGFIDLDDLAHRLLVIHRLLLPYSRRSRQSRKCERFCTLSADRNGLAPSAAVSPRQPHFSSSPEAQVEVIIDNIARLAAFSFHT